MEVTQSINVYTPEQVNQLASQVITAVESANVPTVEEAIARMAVSGECYAVPEVQAVYLYKDQKYSREEVSIFLAQQFVKKKNGVTLQTKMCLHFFFFLQHIMVTTTINKQQKTVFSGANNPRLLEAYFHLVDLTNETLLSSLRRYHHELRLRVPKNDNLANVLLRGFAQKFLRDNSNKSAFDMYVYVDESGVDMQNEVIKDKDTTTELLLPQSERRNTVRTLDVEDCVTIYQLIL
ncbi:hypothetical protein RFI_19897, partial [Reticulomyxa filosa]